MTNAAAGVVLFLSALTAPNDAIAANYSDEEHVHCLAMNMYHEARNQGTAGKLAVSSVVLNRVNDARFPNSVCEVVMQGPTRKSWKDPTISYPIKNRCQFSWYCDGLSDKPKNAQAYKKVLDFSRLIMHNNIQFIDITDGATHYHADYIPNPRWAIARHRTLQIDTHIFYNKNKTRRF